MGAAHSGGVPKMHKIHSTFAMAAATALTAASMIALTPPAAAEEVVVKHQIDRNVPRVVVRYGDLDLDSPYGRDRLTVRLDSAVKKVCGFADYRDIPEYSNMISCRDESTGRAYAARDELFAQRMAARERGETLALAGSGGGSLAVFAQR
ncbi:hypothetical protein DM450_03980 [Sphingomonas sp. IC081]|nr:hypothetical protein DM450_03980 [Sphingomonas sp. IC081]